MANWSRYICSKHFIDANPFPAHYSETQIDKAKKRCIRTKRACAVSANDTPKSKKINSGCASTVTSDMTLLHLEPSLLDCTKVSSENGDAGVASHQTCMETDHIELLQSSNQDMGSFDTGFEESKQMETAEEVTSTTNRHPVGMGDCCHECLETKKQVLHLRIQVALHKNEVQRLKIDMDQLKQKLKESESKQSYATFSRTGLGKTSKQNVAATGLPSEHSKPPTVDPPGDEVHQLCKSAASPRAFGRSTQKSKQQNFFFLSSKLSENKEIFEYYTGMSLPAFSLLWQFVSAEAETLTYRHDPPGKTTMKKPVRIFSSKDELVFTLVRLRRGRTLQEMAYEAGVSSDYISRIFTTWIQLLYQKFSCLKDSMFCTVEQVAKNTPLSLKGKNIRCIIDTTEFACNRPKHFGKNGNRYSAYKGRTTFKVLIGIAPGGYITYISKAYEGSISDVELVWKCGFLEYIKKGDVVMADRGFLIGDVLARKGAKLIIPPFLKGRKRFTPQEEAMTKFIAKNRIHVERAIDRLKQFKLLKGPISSTLESLFSQCVFVCGCLVNFQQPLVS